MNLSTAPKILLFTTAVILTGCADAADRGLGPRCASELAAAQKEFSDAKANSVGRFVDWTQAASLIALAKTQQQFSEFQNCALKAEKAREVISRRN